MLKHDRERAESAEAEIGITSPDQRLAIIKAAAPAGALIDPQEVAAGGVSHQREVAIERGDKLRRRYGRERVKEIRAELVPVDEVIRILCKTSGISCEAVGAGERGKAQHRDSQKQ